MTSWDELEAMAQAALHQFFGPAANQVGIENRLRDSVQAKPAVFGVEEPEETP